jgi:hypothetical protein
MTLHFFAIPTLPPQPAQDEFNRFCLTHRVVNIERQFVGDAVRPVRLALFLIDKPQGIRSVGRQVRGCNQAESSSGCRLFFSEWVHAS